MNLGIQSKKNILAESGGASEAKTTPSILPSDIFQHAAKWSVGDTGSGNALIHGDNLKALTMLTTTHENSIKCAYLDPPYNNGESYQHYHDSMGHDAWLKAVTARLEIIKTLLREDGSVWISIDDSELHYLKVAADAIFGRSNFVSTIVWERRTSRENRKVLSKNHEYILVYTKNIRAWTKVRNTLPLTKEVLSRYKNPDSDPRGPWQSVSANVQDGHATENQYYQLMAPTGMLHTPPKGRCWVYNESKMKKEIAKNNIWFGNNGNAVPRLKSFLSERKNGLTPETLWRAEDVGTTSQAKKHLLELFKETSIFDTPKPEKLIHRILQISSNPGDIILDPYLGSGTTVAVAHKMNRAYIGIEIGEHIKSHCFHRMKQVVAGKSNGISKSTTQNVGGGFDFYKLRSPS